MVSLYFLSLPFVSAFNFSQIFVIPLLVCVLAMVWHGVTRGYRRLIFSGVDFFVLVFVCCVVLSLVFNFTGLDSKSLNHLGAMLAGFGLFYFGASFFSQHLSIKKILGLLFVGYMTSLVFGLVEFVIANFTSFDLNSIVFRPAVEDYTPGFLDVFLIRARSTFEESGYFAAYMAMLGPLMVYYLWHVRTERWLRVVFVVMTTISYFVAFSVSLFIFLPFAILLNMFLTAALKGCVGKGTQITIVLFMVVASVLAVFPDVANQVILRKFGGSSYEDRSLRFAATMDLMEASGWLQFLFGYGPGSYLRLGILPAVSVYLNFFRDLGLLGLVAYLLIPLYAMADLFRARDKFAQAIFLSYLVILLFFISTPHYFLPHYYIPLFLYKLRIIHRRIGVPPASSLPSVQALQNG